MKIVINLFLFVFICLTVGAQNNGRYFKLEEALEQPEKVIYLELFHQDIKDLPKGIGKLINVKEIILRGNDIQTLPKSFKNLKNLEDLSLGNNKNLKVSQVCKTLKKLPKLKSLDLEQNGISQLPKDIYELKGLQKLYLGLNNLSSDYLQIIRINLPGCVIYG